MQKNIIITGASRGIGYELAQQLSEHHNVLAISRSLTNAKIKSGLQTLSIDLADESQYSSVSDFVEENWSQVDVVIHNAGTLLNKTFEDTSLEDFKAVYQVNVFAVVGLTQVLLPYLVKGSHVVSISSIGGVQGSLKFPGLAAYSSSKGALITLSELLAEEYKEKQIAFNVLALGAVQTEMLSEAFPGYQAPIDAETMATFIADFAVSGQRYFNGKVIPVASSTP